MKRNVPLSQIMTSVVQSAHVGQPLSEVRAMMAAGHFHHVPVVSGKTLVGLVSSTDLLRVSYEYGADPREVDAVLDHTVELAGLMQKAPKTLRADAVVRDAVELLAEGKFHSIPVVNADDELVGMVTTTDVLRYLLEQY